MTYIHKQARAGFTLIEILIAIAIVAILGAIVTPMYLGYKKQAAMDATKSSLRTLSTQIEVFNTNVGQYPETLDDLVRRPLNEELAKNWVAPLLKKTPKDGWGKPFVYRQTPDAEHPYELYSYGPKGKSAPQSEWINAWNL
jgi:general secretion pathway protein G